MPETRYIETYENGEVVSREPYTVSDEELAIEQVRAETSEANDNALTAYLNFDKLTLAQKNRVLKGLLGDFIGRNRQNYIPAP